MPQLLVWVNSALVIMEVMLREPFVLIWTVCGVLVVPTTCGPKLRLGGESVTIRGAGKNAAAILAFAVVPVVVPDKEDRMSDS